MPEITQPLPPDRMSPPARDAQLDQLAAWQQESARQRRVYEQRWAKNLRLVRGQWEEADASQSRVRNRSKLFFRKIWAQGWRLLASVYAAFLREPEEVVKIDGVGPEDVRPLAELLQIMVEYRVKVMTRTQQLFVQWLWGFQDIITLGVCVGLFRWVYEEQDGVILRDGPEYTAVAPERVYLDWAATTKDRMRYVILEEFLTKEELEHAGFEQLDQVRPVSRGENAVEAGRRGVGPWPRPYQGEGEYPRPGSVPGADSRKDLAPSYRVHTCFWREGAGVKMAVTDGDRLWLKRPIDSPYGEQYPIVLGQCLTQPHQLVGEGFPESLEGPQESLNATLNARKDNVALYLNRGTIVSRFGGVELQSLINSRPGSITLADDINAVKEREMGDVTQSAYVEAAADENMMEEMSGITAPILGQEKSTKATVAQINVSQSTAKLELYLAIMAETFIKDWYRTLAYFIQRFETDQTLFRVANATWRARTQQPAAPELLTVDGFEADVTVKVGPGAVNRDVELRNLMLAMDRGIMANGQVAQLAAAGMSPPEGLEFFNTTALLRTILPKLGIRNVDDYTVRLAPPQTAPGQASAGAGRQTPQPGVELGSENALQAGGLGGL
jgi:hypothetical protein